MSTYNNPDTDALLTACQTGNPAARDALFARHRSQLKRMVSIRLDARLQGRLDPSDVVQETLAEASVRLPQYLAQRPIPFYPWLRQIAWERLVRLHQQHVRAQRRSVAREARWQPQLPDDSVADLATHIVAQGSSPSGHLVLQEVIRHVRQALDQLTSDERELIILRYVEQLSFVDIGVIQGATPGAIRTRHFRAIRRIQELLVSDGDH